MHNASELRPIGQMQNQSRDKTFFRNRNSNNKQAMTQGNSANQTRIAGSLHAGTRIEQQREGMGQNFGMHSRRDSSQKLTKNVMKEFGSRDNLLVKGGMDGMANSEDSPRSRPSATTLQE